MNEEVLSHDKERLLSRITHVEIRILEQKNNMANAKNLSTFCFEVQLKSLRAHLDDLVGQAVEAGYLKLCACGNPTENASGQCGHCTFDIAALIGEQK